MSMSSMNYEYDYDQYDVIMIVLEIVSQESRLDISL